MGALVIGQELARQAKKRFIFAEKGEERKLELRRGFQLAVAERVLIVEDVMTRGGRIQECCTLIRAAGAVPVGVAVLLDRSAGQLDLGLQTAALIALDFPTFIPGNLPQALKAVPAVKPGSA